jgi:acyl dehydratase
MNHLSERCLEDFPVGQTFGSGRPRIDEDRALAFSAELDPHPHPFHLEEAAAHCSIFGGLAASGWRWSMHTRFRAVMLLLSHLSIT